MIDFALVKRKSQKIVGTKPLNPKTKNHRTRPYQSLLNTYFSLLYSHEGYPKQLTIHNSRMVQHALRYYCNSALLKLYTQQLFTFWVDHYSMLMKLRAPFAKNSNDGMMISPCKLIVRRNHLQFLLYWLDRSLYSLLGLMSGGCYLPPS